MTRNTNIRSINCTSCGAGLDVLGGGRVQTHVCGYCGSELDAQDDYKVLQQYTDLKRPESPFRIGMTGTISGVAYTVIGTIGHKEEYRGRTWRWVDHQLFSPTHGYAYLTVEKGHFIFSRRYRKATVPRWISPGIVERAETPPSVSADGDRYRYYDTSDSEITFVEGEFNWQPKIGYRTSTVSMMSKTAVLAFSRTVSEEEVIKSVYPDQLEIAESFGLESIPALQGVHRLQPYDAGPDKPFVQNTLLYAMIGCVVAYFGLLMFGTGQNLEPRTFDRGALPLEMPFDVTAANRIARVQMRGNIDNSWAYYEIDVEGPDGETVFETGRTISYYSGRDADGSWTEGSQRTSLRFRPTQAGPHILRIGVGEAEKSNAFSGLTVRISEGGLVARWFLFAALFFMVLWIIPAMRTAKHQRSRWAGWDWND